MTLTTLIENLIGGRPLACRERAAAELTALAGDVAGLIMPPQGKSCWRGCALVIRAIGRPVIDSALPELFTWLRDGQNPGADVIARTLLELPRRNFSELLERAAEAALKEGDHQWLFNLLELAARYGLGKKDFQNPEIWNVSRGGPVLAEGLFDA